MFVDSHCHLDRLSDATHGGDVTATLEAARPPMSSNVWPLP
jgi:TatD DNase family protein